MYPHTWWTACWSCDITKMTLFTPLATLTPEETSFQPCGGTGWMSVCFGWTSVCSRDITATLFLLGKYDLQDPYCSYYCYNFAMYISQQGFQGA